MELTGELADGWIGTSFVPEHADVLWRRFSEDWKIWPIAFDLDIQVGGSLEISEDVERLIEARRPAMALALGGMGSAQTNFTTTRLVVQGMKPRQRKFSPCGSMAKRRSPRRA